MHRRSQTLVEAAQYQVAQSQVRAIKAPMPLDQRQRRVMWAASLGIGHGAHFEGVCEIP